VPQPAPARRFLPSGGCISWRYGRGYADACQVHARTAVPPCFLIVERLAFVFEKFSERPLFYLPAVIEFYGEMRYDFDYEIIGMPLPGMERITV
jgi:hypothetical protein